MRITLVNTNIKHITTSQAKRELSGDLFVKIYWLYISIFIYISIYLYLYHEANFLDLNIKIKDVKFQVGLFDKRDLFLFSTVRMPDKSSNVPFSIAFTEMGTESLKIARKSDNPDTFSTAMKQFIACMSRQWGICSEKVKLQLLSCFLFIYSG